MKTYLRKIVAFINDEEGASAIEYALLVGLIALAIVGSGGHSWHQYHRCFHGHGHGDACCSLNWPRFMGAGAGASGLRPLSYEGNQSCRGHRGMQPQRPAPTLGAGTWWCHGVPGPRPRFILKLNTIPDRKVDAEAKPRIPLYGVTTRCLVYPAGPG